jgi:hypothetical protein
LGRLPWFEPLFLRVRRLRARFDIVGLLGLKNTGSIEKLGRRPS